MKSQMNQSLMASKRKKATIKGIIRKSENGRVMHIIIDGEVYFVSLTALKNVLNDVREKTPIYGY
jgi:hypothetical protein